MSKWGLAQWGIDRWPSLTVAALLQQKPAPGRGVPTGLGDWKLAVEILLPSDNNSVWGRGVWGESQWGILAWEDLTPWVRGLEWARGADEPYGRPRIGELTVTLDSNDERFSPWNPTPPLGTVAYFGPGTIIRVGIHSASDVRAGGWLPQITAIVDTWGQVYADATGADLYVDLTAVETLRDLAQIDNNALSGLVGGGETPVERFERLLAEAEWRYGLLVEAQNILFYGSSYPMQSTDMAANRLAECYLVADSCDTMFRTDRTGAVIVLSPEYTILETAPDPKLLPLTEFSTVPDGRPAIAFSTDDTPILSGVVAVPYQLDSFRSGPDDNNLVNDARFARAGGTQQVSEQTVSISRYGRRTLVRNDLLCTSDAAVQTIANHNTVRRGLNVLRVNALTVETSDRGTEPGLAVAAADLGSNAYVYPPSYSEPGNPYILGFIASMTHRVTPRNGAELTWQTTLGFDTRLVLHIPGAQLPSTN